jgi:hypothetical protein
VVVRIPGGSGVTGGATAAIVDRRTIAVVDGRPVAAGVGVVIAACAGIAGGPRSTCVANCSRFARVAAGSAAGVGVVIARRASAIVAIVVVRIPGGSGVTGGASAAIVDGRTVVANVGVVIARRVSAIVASVAVRIAGGSGVTGGASAPIVGGRSTAAMVDGRTIAAGVSVAIASRAIVAGVRMDRVQLPGEVVLSSDYPG